MFLNKCSEIGKFNTSEEQFYQDFGEFPPSPLVCRPLPDKFCVSRVSKIKDRVSFFRLVLKKLRQGHDHEMYGVNEEAKNIIEELVDDFGEVGKGFFETKKDFLALPPLGKVVFFLLFVAASPIFLIALIFISFRFVIKVLKSVYASNDVYGSFNSVTAVVSDKYEGISLDPAAMKLDPESTKAIISHEHIHYRQFLESVSRKSNYKKGKLINGHFLLNERDEDYGRMKDYWFSEVEVEARLHELVIGYYRRFSQLPLSIEEFSKVVFLSPCVLKSKFPGHERSSIKRWVRLKKGKDLFCGFRSKEICLDILLMCDSLGGRDSAIKYVYEVLPVFYSRLLGYYGDSQASKKISDQIVRPNFYDQLYGETRVVNI